MKMLLGSFSGEPCVAGHQKKKSCVHCISKFRVCLQVAVSTSCICFWDLIINLANFYLCSELSDLSLCSVLSWCSGALVLQGCGDE